MRGLLTIACTLILAACSNGGPAAMIELVDGQPDAVGLLAFLNHESTTFELLDVDAGLDRRAAQEIIAHRDGPDGIHGTRDDAPFTTIADVEGVYRVGPATMQRILDYARAHGWIPEGDDLLGVYDGVAFTVDEADATLRVANTASSATLRHDVGLQTQAVNGIIAARPILSVLALSNILYVGPVSVERLRAYALSTPPPVSCAADGDCPSGERCHDAGGEGDAAGVCRHDDELLGVFEGVPFTIGEADASLVLVNLGSTELLTAQVGLSARAVENVALARPLSTIAALSEVPYVGPASLERVRDFARDNPSIIAALQEPPVTPSGCLASDECEAGEACVGLRRYGADRSGVCRDPSGLPGEGSECTDAQPLCAEGLYCVGLTNGWGWGFCFPEWMLVNLEHSGFTVPGGATVYQDFTVDGLASVPFDTVLTFVTSAERPALVITLENLYETPAPVWSHATSEAPLPGYHVAHPPGDEAVNGPWRLRVQNDGATPVTIDSWEIYFGSNWD